MKPFMIALDQGTTSSRAIIFNKKQEIIGIAQREIQQLYPKDGWVEHDPMEIYSTQLGVLNEVLAKSNIGPDQIAAIGITNQRETTIVWDKTTGLPIHNAIVWQCRRTAPICEKLKARGLEPYIKENTGLILDAYFSGTKIMWLLDNIKGARQKAEKGDLLFGTVDTWLMWKLSDGAIFKTDRTNASRTLLFNIKKCEWDPYLLEQLNIPKAMLPQVQSSSEHYGTVNIAGEAIPITGVAGDQQAALFGQSCFQPGDVKSTYGTGCFMLMHTGNKPHTSQNGMLTTIAASQGPVEYAIEGSVFTGGAVIQWLRDELQLLQASEESEYYAKQVPDTGGVYMVPAFTGLGAPYWDMYARGTLLGLTRGSSKAHIVRAALESIAFQCDSLLKAITSDTGIPVKRLKADGGASGNDFLMAFQADISNCPVMRPAVLETTALGAAYLAGLAVGFWNSLDDLKEIETLEKTFMPSMDDEKRQKELRNWQKAVAHSEGWLNEVEQ